MEAREFPTFTPNKANSPTPKAIIYQKYGSEAIEEVLEPPQSGCPGLAILQKGISLYRCILQLPNLSITSGIFRKKEDAEQSAAEMAMEKLGLLTKRQDPTVEEAWDELCDRLKYLFSEKVAMPAERGLILSADARFDSSSAAEQTAGILTRKW